MTIFFRKITKFAQRLRLRTQTPVCDTLSCPLCSTRHLNKTFFQQKDFLYLGFKPLPPLVKSWLRASMVISSSTTAFMILFSRAYEAQNECKNSSRHLCSLDEMMRVWDEVSKFSQNLSHQIFHYNRCITPKRVTS